MTDKAIQSLVRGMIEQVAPAAEIDLWPRLRMRLTVSETNSPHRGTPMNAHLPHYLGRRAAVITLLAVVLAALLFIVTPQGQALAQTWLHFFQQSASNAMPGVTPQALDWVAQTPGVAAQTPTPRSTPLAPAFADACGAWDHPQCSVAHIRALVSFPVIALAELPPGWSFVGATGGPEAVYLHYRLPGNSILFLAEESWGGTPEQKTWDVGTDSVIQSVQVGGSSAEYVKGAYDGSTSRDQVAQWNANLDVQTVRWMDRGVLITLQKLGPEPVLDQKALVELAASLTSGPAGGATAITATPTNETDTFDAHAAFPLTLAQAEQQAGFSLRVPERLPNILTFVGAAWDEKAGFVAISYPLVGMEGNGLLLKEQIVPPEGVCALCGFVVGDSNAVETDVAGRVVGSFQQAAIGADTGQYAEGVWSAKGTTRYEGWRWDPDPYMKRLRWQQNNMAFELLYMGMDLTQADLIAIAESIR